MFVRMSRIIDKLERFEARMNERHTIYEVLFGGKERGESCENVEGFREMGGGDERMDGGDGTGRMDESNGSKRTVGVDEITVGNSEA